MLPDGASRPVFVDLRNLDPNAVKPATPPSRAAFSRPTTSAAPCCWPSRGGPTRVFFTPFNKKAMRFAYPGYDDEIRFVRDVLGLERAASEFNVLGQALERARHLAHPALGRWPPTITQAAHPAGPDAGRRLHARRRLRPAAHRGRRPQSACGRRRQFRSRGDRHDRAGGRKAAGARASPSRGRSRPTRCSCGRRTAISTRC